MAASNFSEAVDLLPFPNGTLDLVDVAAADLECGSIELVQNSTSLNAMKFYGQVSFNCGFLLNNDKTLLCWLDHPRYTVVYAYENYVSVVN